MLENNIGVHSIPNSYGLRLEHLPSENKIIWVQTTTKAIGDVRKSIQP